LSEKRKRDKGPTAAPSPAPATPGEPGANPDAGRKPSSRGAGAGGPMDVGLLAELVKLMAANDLNTVEVRDGDKRVVLKRGPAAPSFTYGAPMSAPMMAPSPSPSQPQAAASGGAGPNAVPPPTNPRA